MIPFFFWKFRSLTDRNQPDRASALRRKSLHSDRIHGSTRHLSFGVFWRYRYIIQFPQSPLPCFRLYVLIGCNSTGVGSACQSNDGKKTPQFTPAFPGTCPYITAVGGTQAVTPEVAWVASSGGFSNYFPRPWYQERAVETYLARHIDNETKEYYSRYTNFAGRGFPDVSAHSLTPE